MPRVVALEVGVAPVLVPVAQHRLASCRPCKAAPAAPAWPQALWAALKAAPAAPASVCEARSTVWVEDVRLLAVVILHSLRWRRRPAPWTQCPAFCQPLQPCMLSGRHINARSSEH